MRIYLVSNLQSTAPQADLCHPVHRARSFCGLIMAGTAATVSVLGLIVFGTLASLLGKIGEKHCCRTRPTLYMLLYIARRHLKHA